MTEQRVPQRHRLADAIRGSRHVFVRDLIIDARVGIHDHEKADTQRIIVSVDLTVSEEPSGHNDRIENVVCYEDIAKRVRAICCNGHVNLVETLAERIAEACLEDRRVLITRVRVEKPEALPDCSSVGIEIERLQALT